MNLARVAGIAAVFGMMLPAQPQQGANGNQEQHRDGKVEKSRGKQEKRVKPQPEPRARQQQPTPSIAQRQQPQHARQAEPVQRQQPSRQEPRAQQQPGNQSQMQRPQEEARAWQQQRGWLKQGGWKGQSTWQQTRAQRWFSDHRTWAQRGGYGGYYIPQDRFRVSFGSQHYFRLRSQPAIYMGYPRFEYGGYSFLLVDPWPEYWADNWYDRDDVYIDYDDGYYLYNRSYPQVRLAITVSLN